MGDAEAECPSIAVGGLAHDVGFVSEERLDAALALFGRLLRDHATDLPPERRLAPLEAVKAALEATRHNLATATDIVNEQIAKLAELRSDNQRLREGL
jgi:septal ring factor EnvC (AmiA/AmiB activator)